jgi:competence protein ComEC
LTGDLASPGLEDVLAEEPSHYVVTLAPHHGSMRIDPTGLLAWSTPQWSVISGSPARDFRRFLPIYNRAGCTPLHTSEYGAVMVRIDATGLKIHCHARRDPQ